MDSLYNQACDRISRMGFTQPEREFIFSDWPEGEEHYKWLLQASREEIDNWIDREAIAE